MFGPRFLRSFESLGWLRGPKLLILATIFVAAASLRCASAPVVFPSPEIHSVEEHRPIPAGDQYASAVEFRKFLVKLPDDHVIGTLQVGKECSGREPLTWKIGRDSTVTQDFGALLLEEVSTAGYGVVGRGDVLFEDVHEKKADYVVAGVIRDVRANVCYANPKGSLATAEASLAIDWQIYSYRTRDVAFKLTTEGSSLLLRPQPEPGADAISRAVVAASRNLLADPHFHELLAGNGADRNPQSRRADRDRLRDGAEEAVQERRDAGGRLADGGRHGVRGRLHGLRFPDLARRLPPDGRARRGRHRATSASSS